jgi:hypothetical protein
MIDQFQFTADDLLVRNKSILDALTKFQDSNARVSRGIIKAVTQCGCIQINGKKQKIPMDATFEETKEAMQTHLKGKLCDNCRDIIEKDIGRNLFYLASICNILDLNLYDIILKEQERLKLLGKYNLR